MSSLKELSYLGSPYTHKDPKVMKKRFDKVCWAASVLMRSGVLAFSPIAHSHPIANYGTPGSWDFWKRFDYGVIRGCCKEVLVLMLDGWEKSVGLTAELNYARRNKIPVKMLSLDDLMEIERGL